nr:MAG TPA: hypothetical protein [Caudoviricetes sp.]
MEIKGIDVSSYQGNPDWQKVSNSGINTWCERRKYGN